MVVSPKNHYQSTQFVAHQGMEPNKEASSSSCVLEVPALQGEDSPLLGSSHDHRLSSQPKTFANIFIAIVGAGMLGLPYTFKKAGWVMGSVMIFSVALLMYRCMMLLVLTRRKLESNGVSKANSYGDLGLAVWGASGRLAVDSMIVLTQVAFCVSYLIFISNTLAHILSHDKGTILGLTPKAFYLLCCFPFQLGLNSVKTLTLLAPLSIFADVADLAAIGVVMVEDLMIVSKTGVPNSNTFGGVSAFFYGLGIAVYSFEGMGMILPLELETRAKHKFKKVLALTMAFISLLFVAFGILGYFAFGEATKDVITTNLGRGVVSIVVQLGICANLFISFPLMMNPVYESLERRFCESGYCVWVRCVAVLGVSLVALFVPNFADFLSFVGSSVCCVLGIVFPASFHLMVFKREAGRTGMILDVVIIVVGVVVTVSGTASSLLEIFSANPLTGKSV